MPDGGQYRTADTDTQDADGEAPDAAEDPDAEGESDADEDPSLLDTVPLPWLLASVTAAIRQFS